MGARFGKSLKLGLAALACTMAASAMTQSAEANRLRRNDCFSYQGGGATGRQMGVRNAQRLFDNTWRRVLRKDCSQVDRLVRIFAENRIAAPATRGAFQACFYQGYTETLLESLDLAILDCSDACFNAGADIGRISAQGYCAASMAVGGLDDPGFIAQPDLPLCGFNVVIGCKSQYIQSATSEIAGCYAFTEGSFYETFDNTVRQDCYVPADVPIRAHGYAMDLSASTAVF